MLAYVRCVLMNYQMLAYVVDKHACCGISESIVSLRLSAGIHGINTELLISLYSDKKILEGVKGISQRSPLNL